MKNVVTQGSQELDPVFLPGDSSAFRTPVFTVMSEIDHTSWSSKNQLHVRPFSFAGSPATFLAFFGSSKFHLGFFQFSPGQIIAWVLHSHISVYTPRGSWYCLLLRHHLLGTTEMHVTKLQLFRSFLCPIMAAMGKTFAHRLLPKLRDWLSSSTISVCFGF